LPEFHAQKSRCYRGFILVLLIASNIINSTKNNQEAAGSETLASIKVKTNKTTVAKTLNIIIATFFTLKTNLV
jgi:hypothetical protein